LCKPVFGCDDSRSFLTHSFNTQRKTAVSNQFQPLADGEVVSVQSTYRVSELAAQIRSKVADTLAEWANENGVDGEALRFGSKGWEKGKVRLHLAIEFCPNDDEAQASSVPSVGSTAPASAPAAPMAPMANFSGGPTSSQQQISAPASIPDFESIALAGPVATATAVATAAPEAALELETEAPPQIDSTLDDEQFELGTMSEITGEIDMQLNDGEPSGYVDFDLSDSLPEVSLDDLVAQSEGIKPSIIDEVWNEMSQPNWPGVSRA
jgi:KGK domain